MNDSVCLQETDEAANVRCFTSIKGFQVAVAGTGMNVLPETNIRILSERWNGILCLKRDFFLFEENNLKGISQGIITREQHINGFLRSHSRGFDQFYQKKNSKYIVFINVPSETSEKTGFVARKHYWMCPHPAGKAGIGSHKTIKNVHFQDL